MANTFDDWIVAHARVASKPHKRITLDDKMAFFRQLSTLIAAGVPLLRAIRIGAEQSQSTKLSQVLNEIAGRVSAGSSFHAAAARFDRVFDHSWIQVIRTGEISGQMNTVLIELSKQIEESRNTRRKVLGAMLYPSILMVVAVASVVVMLWLVVPTFTKMFHDMGARLPGITQFVVDASDFIVADGVYVVIGLTFATFAFRRYARTMDGRRRLIGIGLALPLVGQLLVNSAMYRFATSLALLLKSGVPMLEAIEVLVGIFRMNPPYCDALERAYGRVSAGRPLANSLEETGLFTKLLCNVVHVGEESGAVAPVLDQIAPFYKEKMEELIAKATKLLEPAIIVSMGVTIAGIMLAIYLPMFDMAGAVH